MMAGLLWLAVTLGRRIGMAGCVIAAIWLPHLWLQFLLTFLVLAVCEGFAQQTKSEPEPSLMMGPPGPPGPPGPMGPMGPAAVETLYSSGGRDE